MIAYPYHLILFARRLALVALVVVLAGVTGARAELRLDITRGRVEPMPIAISTFHGQGGQESQVGRDIAQVVSANLERSGLFRPLDPKALIQDPASLHSQPRFADLKIINAQALVSGTVQAQPDGRLRVEFRLWDVIAEQQMTGLAYFTVPENWRRVAHIISDAIYKRITGEEGYFDTRIVYISENGPADKRIKRLAIMDQDGENHRFLTDGRTLVLTPRFSPSAPEITYLSYFNNKPRVYLFNIDTGRQEVLGDFPGMTFAPRFSPDGNKVIMSLATGGNTDIYTMDLRTRRVEQLTNSPAIDTSPSYSPDGQRIVFEFGPRWYPAALCHGCEWRKSDPDHVWAGPLCKPGMVTARRPDRLYEDQRRPFLDRCDSARWDRRTHPERGFPRGRTHLGAKWPCPDVLRRTSQRRGKSQPNRAFAQH